MPPPRGEGMNAHPTTGVCHISGNLLEPAGRKNPSDTLKKERAPNPSDQPAQTSNPPCSSPPSQACARRRRRQGPSAATRSASGRSLTPPPLPSAPENGGTAERKEQPHTGTGLTRPRSFRDECLRSGVVAESEICQ